MSGAEPTWSYPQSAATLPPVTDAVPFPLGMKGFVRGALAVVRGAGRLLSDAQLRRWAAWPVAITGVLYVGLVSLAMVFHGDLLELVWLKPEGWLVYLWHVVSVLVFLGMVVVLALVFLPIAGVISGPFYEKIALAILARRSIPGRDSGVVEGIVSALARLVLFALPAGVFALLSLIPYIGLPFMALATVFGWLGLAAETCEPTLVAAHHPLRTRLRFVFSGFFPMMGAGMVLGLSLLVPLLPLLTLPAAIVGFAELYQPQPSRSDAG